MFSICSFTRDGLSAWTIMLCYSHCLFAAWTNVQKFPNTPDETDYSEIIFLGGSIIQGIFCPILYYSWIVQILIKNNNQMQTVKYLQYWESFQLWRPAVCILRGCNTFQTTFNPLIMNAFKTFDTENEIQLESLEIHSVMDASQEWIF